MFDRLLKKTTIGKVMLLLAILYIIPTFINYDFNTGNRFIGAKISLPYLYAGDQIHYYVMVYSLLKDRDLDVKNNYDNSEFNMTYDAGYLFRGQHLFREAGYFNFKTRDYQPLWVENTSENIESYGQGKVFEGTQTFETPNPGKDYGMLMIRPWGLPLFYYALLLPFSFAANPEPFVVFLTVLLVLLGIYLFYLTLNHLLKDKNISALFTLFLGVSSELWLYSKIFSPDVLQFSLLSLITYLFIVRDDNLLPGILFAIGVFARPTFIILLPVFIAYRFFSWELGRKKCAIGSINPSSPSWASFQRIKGPLLMLLPVVLILAVQSYINYYFFGSISSNPNFQMLHIYPNIFEGILASFFRLDRGILVFSPVLLFAFFSLKSFYNKNKKEAMFIYALPLCFILFFSLTVIRWYNMDMYSVRYYLPILPYFYIPISFWYKDTVRRAASKGRTGQKNRIWLMLFYVALAISILINMQAAIFSPLSWNGPPWRMISLFFENIGKLRLIS